MDFKNSEKKFYDYIKKSLKDYLKYAKDNGLNFMDWAAYGVLAGIVVGFISSVFALLLEEVTDIRMHYPYIMAGLPFAGLLIVFMYHHVGERGDKGTNLVLDSVREGKALPWYMAVRIFIATAITHLFGGSAGREGAALQLGGSISSVLAKLIGREKKDSKITLMCGMSGAFSAIFGTPIAASIFAMEVVNVGHMYYSALVPCAFAALTGSMVAKSMHVKTESFTIFSEPEFTVVTFVKVLILAVLCACISMLFCIVLHTFQKIFKKYFKTRYGAVFAAGSIIVVLTAILQTTDYMGTGMDVIAKAIAGNVHPEAFLLKMLFTGLALGSCYKGGEIVPSFFVGATFGCLCGNILGISPSLCAAVGMVSVFCGVTNCPITSLLIAAELFGFDGVYYFLIGVVVSYMLSGYYTLYSSQKIIYGKNK